MLGVVLLYVGIVLINNGICRISKIDPKSTAVMNVFVGTLSVICNIIIIIHGDMTNSEIDYYVAATGLLFGFTYLLNAIIHIYNLDWRIFGWYSLFVAINSIPAAYLSYMKSTNQGFWFAIIWFAWGILWLTGWIETVLNIELKFVPYLAILEGIFTAWFPAWLFFMYIWS
ncbi:acid-activated urea channel [Helicobacter didelphidarum]|uniref:Acid-activated urea channel n=1 Tax=Helicobacter didelphidarum TaxID=2040648 RepID=A0A3D8ILR4_9HELI|nr:AmiS/UreI family transporter [Helicobacter didelphidarum]RDU66217.1 acid-activated urea channel [Helicobacter didelphidarum]